MCFIHIPLLLFGIQLLPVGQNALVGTGPNAISIEQIQVLVENFALLLISAGQVPSIAICTS
jgi:hypothetical protein